MIAKESKGFADEEIRSERLEAATRAELPRCLPSNDLHTAYQAELQHRLDAAPQQRDLLKPGCADSKSSSRASVSRTSTASTTGHPPRQAR